MAKTTTIAGNTFLFTGKLTEFTREDAEAHVEAEGGKVLSGVSAKLNYLVVGEDAGSKLAKAEALGTVTILHEKEFLKMMNSGKSNGSDPSKQNLTKKKIFKAKKMEGIYGVDFAWISSYNLMTYNTEIDVFTLNETKRVFSSMTNLSAFLGFSLGEFRFFTRMENIGYFWNDKSNQVLVGFPIQKNFIRLGLTWDFFN